LLYGRSPSAEGCDAVAVRKRGIPRYGLIVLAATVGVAIGLGAALVHNNARSPAAQQEVQPLAAQVTWAAGTKPATGFRLRDQSGRLVSLRHFRGRTVLLTFLDSVCKLECPVEGRVLREVQRRIAGTNTVTAVVSVDPWADTAATALSFARKSKWHGTWYWLRGTRARLAAVWRAYGIGVRRERGDVAHSTALYLIDAQGDLRAGYAFPFSVSTVAHDVRAVASS
jgi:cytochrome oxidase Cu insertion factor (SCO1/SenC/PrrC family)